VVVETSAKTRRRNLKRNDRAEQARRPGNDSILCKRASKVINERANALGALAGFGQQM
jgi:hypothetical protein